MARKIMSISIPAEYLNFIQWRIRNEGYASVSEYFRNLVRQDRRAVEAERDRIEREIMREMAGGRAPERF
jgi:Arc/MetJ-type ribon-helix-helix transcriptional regulator